MPSPPPLLFDTHYHIYNRGINGENIFIQEKNYSHFLNLYSKYIEPVAEIYAYCLLRNHFHMLVRIKAEDEILGSLHPSKRFSDFFNSYAKAINAAYGRTGSLFQHPFGRVKITSDKQLLQVMAYIHQNPQKHGFVTDFREWEYSSYGVIMASLPTNIKRDEVIRLFGGIEIYRQSHREQVSQQQSRDFAGDDAD